MYIFSNPQYIYDMLKLFWVNKKHIKIACIAVCVCFIGVVIISHVSKKNRQVNATPQSRYTIVIDAGHGGIDGGVLGATTGVKESEINLSIAKKLKELFSSVGFNCVMTRITSSGLYGYLAPGHKDRDMRARAKIINESNPSLVISIHQNKYSSPSRRGGQAFYKKGDKQSYLLATTLQQALNGVYTGVKDYAPLCGDYFILNVSPCPAVIVECGFLSNPQDEALLITEEFQLSLATAIFNGSLEFLVCNE